MMGARAQPGTQPGRAMGCREDQAAMQPSVWVCALPALPCPHTLNSVRRL